MDTNDGVQKTEKHSSSTVRVNSTTSMDFDEDLGGKKERNLFKSVSMSDISVYYRASVDGVHNNH